MSFSQPEKYLIAPRQSQPRERLLAQLPAPASPTKFRALSYASKTKEVNEGITHDQMLASDGTDYVDLESISVYSWNMNLKGNLTAVWDGHFADT